MNCKLSVVYKGSPVSIKRLVKNAVVKKIKKTVVIVQKQVDKWVSKYNRYYRSFRRYKLSPVSEVREGDIITIGYVGRKLSPTLSHVLVAVTKRPNGQIN